jgi:hypothetical protein
LRAQRGNPAKNIPRSEQNHDVVPLRGNHLIIWIATLRSQ